MDELKPCPFCGGKHLTDSMRGTVYVVGCVTCAATVLGYSHEEAITAWNTRAASGGDSASLEQRARGLFDSMMGATYGDTNIGHIVCAETTRGRLESAWLPLITAALANQQGVGGQVGTFFAADPALGEFNRHASLEAAKADAQKMFDYASDDAADSGWADDPPQICYGIVLGHCVEVAGSRRPAPEGSDFTELVEFELAATQPAGDVGSQS